MARYNKPSELIVCDICGKKMRSRGYGNHVLQVHKMKLTQVTEKRKPHLSEKPPHLSERGSSAHLSEKPVAVVKKEIVTTKRVYVPRENLPNIHNAPDPLSDNPVEAKRGKLFWEKVAKKSKNK